MQRLPTCLVGAVLVVALSLPPAAASGQPSQRPPVVVEVRDDSFRWGDAAVGAAATLGLVLAGAGAVLVLRRSPAPPSERRETQ